MYRVVRSCNYNVLIYRSQFTSLILIRSTEQKNLKQFFLKCTGYVKIISYYIVITKWLCNWWSRWPLLILRSKVKMLWNFLSISRTPYHISRYKVKGQASVNIGKYFLRIKYIEFLSNFVHCHIWRSRDSGTFDF